MLMELQPYQTPMADTRLAWMMEAMPQELERMYGSGELKSYLNAIVQRAEDVVDALMADGRREDEALEIVSATILAPELPDTDQEFNLDLWDEIREHLDS